jgi:hypothetical protein
MQEACQFSIPLRINWLRDIEITPPAGIVKSADTVTRDWRVPDPVAANPIEALLL